MTVWVGNAPKNCDNCNDYITDSFYDARMDMFLGSWGNVCPRCFILGNGRLGVGYGQHYKKEGDHFVCVAGGRKSSRSGQ